MIITALESIGNDMKFVQYKQDVIWKEGRMFMRGSPLNVEDNYAIGVFSSDPQFEEFKEIKHETQVERQDAAPEILVDPLGELPITWVPRGKECSQCHKLISRGWYMHQKWCKG